MAATKSPAAERERESIVISHSRFYTIAITRRTSATAPRDSMGPDKRLVAAHANNGEQGMRALRKSGKSDTVAPRDRSEKRGRS